MSESRSSTPAGVWTNETEPTSWPFASLSMALAVSAAPTVTIAGTEDRANVASTEARLRSFMRDLPEPSAAPPESPEYSGTPETQPCSGGSHPSRGERYSKLAFGAGDDGRDLG